MDKGAGSNAFASQRGGWLREAGEQQRELLGLLWAEPRFRTPMLALWLSDLGSSLHRPVVTFFYLELGATAMDIGKLSFVMRGAIMLLSPIYGRLVDRFGLAYPLLLSVSACGFGCFLRGTASSVQQLFLAAALAGIGGGSQWSMVKGYVAGELEDEKRALLVVGLKVQMTFLSLGTFLYPALDSFFKEVGMHDDLTRYRAEVATCTAFCWVGIAILLCGQGGTCSKSSKQGVHLRVQQTEDKEGAAAQMQKGNNNNFNNSNNNNSNSSSCSSGFALAAVVLGTVSCCQAMCVTLWPIYIKHNFGWQARAYSYLTSAQTVLMTLGLAAYPSALQRGLRPKSLLQVLAALSSVTLGGFFVGPSSTSASEPPPSFVAASAHVLLSVCCLVLLTILSSGAEAAASLHSRSDKQGSAMGVLNSAAAGGAMVGSLMGPFLWTFSLDMDAAGPSGGVLWLLKGGRLPFFVAEVLLGVSCVLLHFHALDPDLAVSSQEARACQAVGPVKVGASIMEDMPGSCHPENLEGPPTQDPDDERLGSDEPLGDCRAEEWQPLRT